MIKRQLLVLLAIVSFGGCSATAIIPAKVTYTYPLAEPLAAYESPEGIGSVAYQDEGTIELYLPLLKARATIGDQEVLRISAFKPKRFVFNPTATPGVWENRKDSAFTLRVISAPTTERVGGGSRDLELREGHLLITFPGNARKYGDLAGKKLWLNSAAGPDEVFRVRGLYWKSKISFLDLSD